MKKKATNGNKNGIRKVSKLKVVAKAPVVDSSTNKIRVQNAVIRRMNSLRYYIEEQMRLFRLEQRREKITDEEWDELEKISQQQQKRRQQDFSQNYKSMGQSDYYSGLEYLNKALTDVSQNFSSLRRENGRFGSYPTEDSYSDDAIS